MTHKIKWLR